MTADILLFTPRSNQKADRAFWVGANGDVMSVPTVSCSNADQFQFDSKTATWADTAPSEFNSGWVQDSGDCA